MLLLFGSGNLVATPSNLSFNDPVSAAKTITLSGGTAPYSISTAPSNTIATAVLSGSTCTVTPVGAGSASIVFSDSVGHNITVPLTVGPAMSISPTSIPFLSPPTPSNTPTAVITISGGAAPYTASNTNNAVITVSVVSNTVVVTSVGLGSDVVTIHDADGETQTCSVTVAYEPGRVLHFSVQATPTHYISIPPALQPGFVPPWQTAPTDGSPFASGTQTRRHILSPQGGNLLYNTKAMGGLRASLADIAGWSTFSSGVACTWASSTLFGGSFHASYAGGATLGGNLIQQLVGSSTGSSIPVQPNTTYTFSAMVTTSGAGQAYLQAQTEQTAFQYNSFVVPAGSNNALVYVTFTTGATDFQVLLKMLVNNGTGTGAMDVYFYDPQFEQGSNPTPFNTNYTAATHDTIFDGAANARASTHMNTNIPNSTAFFEDFTIQYSLTGTSPSITATIWYDNGSGADAFIYLPNYATTIGDRDINVGHTTQAAPSATVTSLSTSGTVYILAYYIPGTGMHFLAQKTAFTIAQIRTAVQDGGYIANYATVGTGATFTASGTGGSIAGNGGHVQRQ